MPRKVLKDKLVMEFKDYRALVQKEEKVFFVKEVIPGCLGDIRRLNLFPPVYVVIVDELSLYNEKLFKAIPFVEEIPLGWLGVKTPVLNLKKYRILLCALPFWVYLTEDFIQRFSEKLGALKNSELSKLLEYAENQRIPETVQGKYIRLVMQRLSKFNAFSLLHFLERISFYESSPQVIELPRELAQSLEEYSYQRAAAERDVFKGKNFFAKIEKSETSARLILYLPQEYIGKKVTIRLKDDIIFEGELQEDKLVIKSLPLLLDYSILEEELYVQI